MKTSILPGKTSPKREIREVSRAMVERRKANEEALVAELIKGERSGFVNDFDGDRFLDEIHERSADKRSIKTDLSPKSL